MSQRLTVSVMWFVLILLTGCQKHFQQNVSESVRAEPQLPVHYQVAINRTTKVVMENDSGQNNSQTMTEELMVELSFGPVSRKDNPMVFKVVCNSVQMNRSDFVGTKSAAEALCRLQGKEFTLTVSPEKGLLDDVSVKKMMNSVVNESVEKTCKGTFKEPDMLLDFYNTVVYLCVSAAKENYSQGQRFTRFEPTPTPAIEFSLPQRQIACTVDLVINQEGVRKAKISEVHSIAEDAQIKPSDIYSGQFKTMGLFSSLRHWKTQSIQGTGVNMIDFETGFVESLDQHWQVRATAGFTIPINNTNPMIIIDETISCNKQIWK